MKRMSQILLGLGVAAVVSAGVYELGDAEDRGPSIYIAPECGACVFRPWNPPRDRPPVRPPKSSSADRVASAVETVSSRSPTS